MHKDLPIQCEHKVDAIINEQERAGVSYNKLKASMLMLTLAEKITEIDKEAVPQLPLMMMKAGEYKKPFLKSKAMAKWPSLYCKEVGLDPSTVKAPFSRVWFEPFDMSKTDRVKRVLLEEGWVPDEWNLKNVEKDSEGSFDKRHEIVTGYITKNFMEEKSSTIKNLRLSLLRYKGARTFQGLYDHLIEARQLPSSPKITESSLHTVQGTVGRLVMKRVQLSHRLSLLRGLNKRVRPDGKLSAGANPCATPTFRMKHRVVVNIPAARSYYGPEIRSLFRGDYRDGLGIRSVGGHRIGSNYEDFVGYDGAGLELRMFAHYINDPTYTQVILEGDIHSHNQKLAGLPTRDDAKTFIYALLYGAGDAKIGEIIGGTARDGANIRARFLKELPSLQQIIDKTQKEALTGYLVGLDGRQVRMRRGWDGQVQTHKALNTLLQSAGAIVMKYSMIFLDQWAKEAKLDAHKVLDMHDEGQWTSHPDSTPELQHYMDKCVEQAGVFLNLNIPLASDSMVGANWLHTH